LNLSKTVEVEILSLNDVNSEILLFLSKEIPFHLPVLHCRIASRRFELPTDSYDPQREQYNSSRILDMLASFHPQAENGRVLAVTSQDLFVPGLNFVFGQAMGGYAMISLARLSPRFYGLREDGDLYLRRITKEAVHELGHTLGLMHCRDQFCVMHFSNSILDTDRKSSDLCATCKRLIGIR
jgi:archaemetzincin